MNNPFKNLFRHKAVTSATETTYSDSLISDTYTVTGTSTANKYIITPNAITPVWEGGTGTITTPWHIPTGSGPSGGWEQSNFNTFEVLFGNILSAIESSNKEMTDFYTNRVIEYLIQKGWSEKIINMTIETLHESLRNIEYEDIDL